MNLRSNSGKRRADCPECGAWLGLHALSCSRYVADSPPGRLSEVALAELRALAPSMWRGWPVEEYDQGLPVVEVRQDHLASLIAEVEEARSREGGR